MSDNNNLSDEGWNELEEQFELLHPDFMLKLETLGNFKTTEKRVFLLRKMGFSPIEISKLACLSPQAVTSIRSRAYYKITHQKGSPDQMDELLLKL
jgi:DNA-directed RNA polymerase specialized sigma24 family protein